MRSCLYQVFQCLSPREVSELTLAPGDHASLPSLYPTHDPRRDDSLREFKILLHAIATDLKQPALAQNSHRGPFEVIPCNLVPSLNAALTRVVVQFLASIDRERPTSADAVQPKFTVADAEPRIYICTEDCPMRAVLRPPHGSSWVLGEDDDANAASYVRYTSGTKPVCQTGASPCGCCGSVCFVLNGRYSGSQTAPVGMFSGPSDPTLRSALKAAASKLKRAAERSDTQVSYRSEKRRKPSSLAETDADTVYFESIFGSSTTHESAQDQARMMGTVAVVSDPEKKYGSALHEAETDPSARRGSALAAAIVSARAEFERSVLSGKELTRYDWARIDGLLSAALKTDTDVVNSPKFRLVAGNPNPLSARICAAWEHAVEEAMERLTSPYDSLVAAPVFDESECVRSQQRNLHYDNDVEMGDPRTDHFHKELKSAQDRSRARLSTADSAAGSFVDAKGEDATVPVRRPPRQAQARRELTADVIARRIGPTATEQYEGKTRSASKRRASKPPINLAIPTEVIGLDWEPTLADKAAATKNLLVAGAQRPPKPLTERKKLRDMVKREAPEDLLLSKEASDLLKTPQFGLIEDALYRCRERQLSDTPAAQSSWHEAIDVCILPIVASYYEIDVPHPDEEGIDWDEKFQQSDFTVVRHTDQGPVVEFHKSVASSVTTFDSDAISLFVRSVSICLRGRVEYNYQYQLELERQGRHHAEVELIMRELSARVHHLKELCGRWFNRYLTEQEIDQTSAAPGGPHPFVVSHDEKGGDDALGIVIRTHDELVRIRKSFDAFVLMALIDWCLKNISTQRPSLSSRLFGTRQSRDIGLHDCVYMIIGHSLTRALDNKGTLVTSEGPVGTVSCPSPSLFNQFIYPCSKMAFYDVYGISIPLSCIAAWAPYLEHHYPLGMTSKVKNDAAAAMRAACASLALSAAARPEIGRTVVFPMETAPTAAAGPDTYKRYLSADIKGMVKFWELAASQLMDSGDRATRPSPAVKSEFVRCSRWMATAVSAVLMTYSQWHRFCEADAEYRASSRHIADTRVKPHHRLQIFLEVLCDVLDLAVTFCSPALSAHLMACRQPQRRESKSECEHPRMGDLHVSAVHLSASLFREKRSHVSTKVTGLRHPMEIPNNVEYASLLALALSRSRDALDRYRDATATLPANADQLGGPVAALVSPEPAAAGPLELLLKACPLVFRKTYFLRQFLEGCLFPALKANKLAFYSTEYRQVNWNALRGNLSEWLSNLVKRGNRSYTSPKGTAIRAPIDIVFACSLVPRLFESWMRWVSIQRSQRFIDSTASSMFSFQLCWD